MIVIYTDLDGTLLDGKTYSFEPARPAMELLRSFNVPLVFCTSKTLPEVEMWRTQIGNNHPFIVENGGGLFIPRDYFRPAIQAPLYEGAYAVFEFGDVYPDLVRVLKMAAEESSCTVRGFHDMTVEEVSTRCDMSSASAALAKQRRYDEPFEILDGDPKLLFAAIMKHQKRWTRGDRFYHILGVNDKSHCVDVLTHLYRRAYQEVLTIGMGDDLNDVGFLNMVDIPILMNSPTVSELAKEVPFGHVSRYSGPDGWSEELIEIVSENTPFVGAPWFASMAAAAFKGSHAKSKLGQNH